MGGWDMARTDVYTFWGRVLGVFMVLGGCNGTMSRPVPPVVPIDPNMMVPSSEPAEEARTEEEASEVPETTEPQATAGAVTNTAVSPDEPMEDDEYADVPTGQAAPAPPETRIVHHAELRGRVEAFTGKQLTIEPLVMTSETLPVPGCMANLWVATNSESGEADWRYFSEVKVAASLHFGESMVLDILDASKPGRTMLSPGSRVRVQWEW